MRGAVVDRLLSTLGEGVRAALLQEGALGDVRFAFTASRRDVRALEMSAGGARRLEELLGRRLWPPRDEGRRSASRAGGAADRRRARPPGVAAP